MAIEFYDSEKKFQLHQYFLKKLNELMSKQNVIEYLDDIQNKSKEKLLQYDTGQLKKEIFANFKENSNEDQLDIENRKQTADILKSFDNISPLKIKAKTLNKPLKTNITENKGNDDELKQRLSSFNLNLNKLQDNISSDIKNQSNIFEEKKRNKMEKLKSCKGGKL